ncbi:PAS domain S-box protein [Candidatus Reidiella endopervernicosa]|uniref:PAS domain S-box protein n=1 Tax=Candidatus Reidiella endopervernicosa TaxID=2738883 RepID=UPI003B967CEE
MELLKSDAKYRRLVGNLQGICSFVKCKGIVNYVTPSIKSLLGYLPEQVCEHRYDDFLADIPSQNKVKQRMEETLHGKQQTVFEAEVQHKDGSTRTFDITAVPINDESGKVASVEGVAHEITYKRWQRRHFNAIWRIRALLHRSCIFHWRTYRSQKSSP